MLAVPSDLVELLGFDPEQARTAAGMSKQALCQVAGIALRQYHLWLRGEVLPGGRSVLRLRRWFAEHDFGEQHV